MRAGQPLAQRPLPLPQGSGLVWAGVPLLPWPPGLPDAGLHPPTVGPPEGSTLGPSTSETRGQISINNCGKVRSGGGWGVRGTFSPNKARGNATFTGLSTRRVAGTHGVAGRLLLRCPLPQPPSEQSRHWPKVAQQLRDRDGMRIQACSLYRLWALPCPSPTDLSARSRVRPEKSKKLRYSPATSLLNSLLPGEHGVSMRSGAQQTTGGTWAVVPRYPDPPTQTFPPLVTPSRA